ncbi:UDP-4-amino-4,6-dideoxy-N-acetyl-beta-L-altrosamine N-acetyltransferase [Helicobacter saguini]|uniref:UDP-4-amino-4, 6-dideoxy-N-acetyl-beta-L-altrosamine N-acetyltransferase n=2 Tax=Helicobacter saguini TaxID=1548018 RepID=A0A347VIC0_9HELI|nr:UDP-4-amino-4,6-dideoxy-N-acetyl-beta-L-altrosamine N-acetyltransferase [Helicobacter saguini]
MLESIFMILNKRVLMKIRILTENLQGLGLGHVARCFNLSAVFLEMGYEVDFFVRGNADFMGFINTQMQDSNTLNSQDFYKDSKEYKTSTDSKHLHILEDSNSTKVTESIINFNKNINSNITNFNNKKVIESTFKYFYPLALQWENITHKSLIECDICIIDSYHLNEFKGFLFECFKCCKIVCLLDDDGLYLELFKQNIPNFYILNPNGFYNLQGLESTQIFSGLQYALLNKCFLDSKRIKKKYDFFVCLGGEDKRDISNVILTRLNEFNFSVCVVLGANYKGKLLQDSNIQNNTESNSQNTQKSYIFHNIKQEKLAKLMAESKACIVSGGGIIFEALSVCKSVFALNLANNQNKQIEILQAQGLVKEIKIDFSKNDIKITKKIKKDSINIGTKVRDFASILCMCAINSSLNLTHNKKEKNFKINLNTKLDSIKVTESRTFNTIKLQAINFCNLSASESLRVLQYRNHPFVSKSMYGSAHISAKTHFDFIESLRHEENSKYFLVQEKSEINTSLSHNGYLDIGVVSLTRINLKHKHAYLGIYKNPLLESYNFKNIDSISYGEKLIEVIKFITFNEYNLKMLFLEVFEKNIRAIKLYEKMGFKMCGRLSNYVKIDNEFQDVFVYELKNNLIKIL